MPTVLSSWKEIADYFGKDVRSVRRWEAKFGLPIHRHWEKRQRVIAYPDELEQWLGSTVVQNSTLAGLATAGGANGGHSQKSSCPQDDTTASEKEGQKSAALSDVARIACVQSSRLIEQSKMLIDDAARLRNRITGSNGWF
jgi:hypothetical protein